MDNVILLQGYSLNQASRDGSEFITKRNLLHFVEDLIRENKIVHPDGYSLSVSDLTHSDQKLFLSHIIDAFDYEWACENRTRLDAMIQDQKKYMQRLIDHMIDEIYWDDRKEARFYDYDTMRDLKECCNYE